MGTIAILGNREHRKSRLLFLEEGNKAIYFREQGIRYLPGRALLVL